MDFIELLDKQHGQNPNLVKEKLSLASESKRTLLHVSAALGFHQVVTALVDHRVDLNLRDMSGFGALHYAALNGRLECAKLLVDGGANLEIMDRWGLLAQEVAVDTDHHDIGQMLEARRSNPHGTIKGAGCEDLDTGVLAVGETAHLPVQRPGATGSAGEQAPDQSGRYIAYWCRIFRFVSNRILILISATAIRGLLLAMESDPGGYFAIACFQVHNPILLAYSRCTAPHLFFQRSLAEISSRGGLVANPSNVRIHCLWPSTRSTIPYGFITSPIKISQDRQYPHGFSGL